MIDNTFTIQNAINESLTNEKKLYLPSIPNYYKLINKENKIEIKIEIPLINEVNFKIYGDYPYKSTE